MVHKALKDYGGAVLAAIVIALIVRFFVIEAYRIPSATMRPTLEPGDTIFVAKWPYGLRVPFKRSPVVRGRAPRRGEIVVFSLPEDPAREFIKRVIALPGDTIELRKGKPIVNGAHLTVSDSPDAVCGRETNGDVMHGVCWEPPLLPDMAPEKVPEGSIFVLGDLRTDPKDIRKNLGWGLVPMQNISARALWVWLSIEPKRGSGWFSRIRFYRMFKEIS